MATHLVTNDLMSSNETMSDEVVSSSEHQSQRISPDKPDVATSEMTRSHDDDEEDEEDSNLILAAVEVEDEPLISDQPAAQQPEPHALTPASPVRVIATTAGTTRQQQQQIQRRRWWWWSGPRVPPTTKLAEHLARRLYDASDILLARLFTYLSNLPEPTVNVGGNNFSFTLPIIIDDEHAISGVTLPASAVAWLSSQIVYLRRNRHYHHQNPNQSLNDSLDEDFFDTSVAPYSLDGDHHPPMENALWMGSSMRDRLLLIHFLLPRATHLRIVPEAWPSPKNHKRKNMMRRRRLAAGTRRGDVVRARKQNNNHPTSPLEADQDLAFSSMSVQSALTEDDAGPPEPNAASFLQNYYQLEQRPRIDLSIFTNLQVLVLDQVPPDCIVNLHAARDTLCVLRVERACIYHLSAFLFPTQQPPSQAPSSSTSRSREISKDEDPLAAPDDDDDDEHDNDSNMVYSQLTHLKLSHCCLGEISGMRGSPTCPVPPLSRFPRLVSLCLSHNQIFKSSTALAGLSSLSWLVKLDLSYNQIVSMKNAHLRLGNLKVLVLTGNKIRSASGLDRLYSLEQLWLDGNQIRDVASLNGLGRLPELHTLYLHDNPLELLHPLRYRIDVLNLFMCRLTSSLGPNATYRQLQVVLPSLDGKVTSLREMVALRNRTFQSIIPPSPGTPLSFGGEDTVVISNVDGNVSMEEGDPNASTSMETTTAIITAPTPRRGVGASASKRQGVGRVRRGVRRRKAVIEDSHVVVVRNAPDRLERATTTVAPPSLTADEPSLLDAQPLQSDSSRNVAFSIQDVISAICSDYGGEEPTMTDDEIMPFQDQEPEHAAEILEDIFTKEEITADETEVHGVIDLAAVREEVVAALTREPDPATQLEEDITQLSLTKNDGDSQALADNDIDGQNVTPSDEGKVTADGVDFALAANPFENQLPSSNVVEHKAASTLALDKEATPTNPFESKLKAINPFDDEATSINPFDDEIATTAPKKPAESQVVSKTPSENQPAWTNALDSRRMSANNSRKDASSIESLSENIDRSVVTFTDDVWQDDRSVASSIGGPREELSVDVKFQLAEENSVYDGPPGYQDLLVLEHLELYFRCFVFPTAIPPAVQAALNETTTSIDATCEMALLLYPRLQLQPIDRQWMLTANSTVPSVVAPLAQLLSHREQLVRVWREDVVACGKPAARRLFPNRHTRLGFHGDILWAPNSKMDVVTERRSAILCLSNAALYVILDHDAVTDKLKEHTKKFPLPMSKESKFQDAPWPHAVARHSLLSLEQITIGFGFQRLILRFSNATFPSNDPFTYNLLVSNKVETISMLQDLQRSVKDAGMASSTSGAVTSLRDERSATRLEIDNDDKHFLEALASAVTPAVIGAVLHYQVLQQRWQHGERGSVRRVCVVTDSKLFLLDEDYAGDGSSSFDVKGGPNTEQRLGDVSFRLVDSADLQQITQVKAADADPKAITIVIRPLSRLQRTHRWRLVCRDGDGAERLVEDVRKAMSFL